MQLSVGTVVEGKSAKSPILARSLILMAAALEWYTSQK